MGTHRRADPAAGVIAAGATTGWRRAAMWLLVGLLGAPHTLAGQGTAVDEAVARARALVESGDGRAGRLVLDSLVRQAGLSTPALGELLYWRGLLSESSLEAERDWRRLLLEVPMSPRAEDALLRLAQLEQLRGRPAASRTLLERLMREYPDAGSQARAQFWMATSWFDENDRPRACSALEVVRRDAPTSAVELRLQADDLSSRCREGSAGADTSGPRDATALPRAVTADRATADRATADRSTPVRTTPAPASVRPANARYSVQLSAVSTLSAAEQFVQRLRARGVADARVDGSSAPFRVRTGYFATRAQATARLAELKR